MKHECWWDARLRCVRFKLIDELAPAEAAELMDQLELLGERHRRHRLIVDHTLSPRPVSRETRAVLERRASSMREIKIAFFGMNNLNRMIAQIIISITGLSQRTQFFASPSEAEAWISADA